MNNRIIIIGGGVAGMQAALSLREAGLHPVILEKQDRLGGKVASWYKLFPDFTPSGDVVGPLRDRVLKAGIDVRTGCGVKSLRQGGVRLDDGSELEGAAVIVASGFELFDARRKEEYGFGIYRNVFTSVQLEEMFISGKVQTAQGEAPKRVAFLHCVGSRDEKVGAHHCSKVCCITGVKQAIEMKERFPNSEIYNFYMDIRMFGPGYEELYRQAQLKYNINFLRGRISEASQTIDGRVQIKAEDTLVGRPLKMTVDMLVLVIGMKGGDSNRAFAETAGLAVAPNGFMPVRDPFMGNTCSEADGIFYAGAVTAPKTIGESLNEGVAAAHRAGEYVKSRKR